MKPEYSLPFLGYIGFCDASILHSPVKRSQGTATVSLAQPSGTPRQLGSGVLYGIPINDGEVSTKIADKFYKEIGFNYGRAGGAAWGSPHRGWAVSPDEYPFRFQAVLSNYRTTRKFGAPFILLPHDLWGIDNKDYPLPGDDDDWSKYDSFLTKMISDIKENDMTSDLVIDIWNEPDGSGYWPRPQSQYHQLWARTYDRLRSELSGVKIAGPATAFGPASNNPVFTAWAEFVTKNGSIPDIYTWHSLSRTLSPQKEADFFQKQRTDLKMPSKPIIINEYLAYDEEGPGPVAWYLGQFERLGFAALRANWAKYGANAEYLHDFLANLLGSKDGSYYPNGEWQVYKYYASMSGQRVSTTPSSDGVLEVFATTDPIKILAAVRHSKETYSITVKGLKDHGITGRVRLASSGFTWNGVFGSVGDPVSFGSEILEIKDDAITFEVRPRTAQEAYAFELTLVSS